jgi:hypothetical protein
MTMKTNSKKMAMKLGDFVAGAYRAWGSRRAKGLVRLALHTRLVVFREPQYLEI